MSLYRCNCMSPDTWHETYRYVMSAQCDMLHCDHCERPIADTEVSASEDNA